MNNTAPAPALTVKESALLAAITEGMDAPGCGWLHELADANRSTNAVLGSLIKKGLVHSHKDTEGVPGVPSYWVELTPAGEALAPAAAPAAPAPELTSLPLIRKIQAAALAPLLPGEAVAPAAPAPAGPAPELPAFVTHQQQQQQPQQGREWRSPARGGRVAWDEPGESAAALAALPVLPPASKYSAPCPPKASEAAALE